MARHTLLPVLVAAALLSGGSLERASCAASEPAENPALADTVAPRSDGATRDSTASASPAESPALPDAVAPRSDAAASAPPEDRVAVYYFHRTARCDNCLKFEAYADQALRESCADKLTDGALEWWVVNIDDTTNAHFVDDYDLVEISLIVSRVRGGQEVHWRNLDAIWTLVDDKDAFLEYVESEVGEELKRLNGPQPEDPDSVPVLQELVPEQDGGGSDNAPQG